MAVDTNVLVSAFATRGLCSDVLQLAIAEHDLVIGEVVLVELRRILTIKFKIPEQRVEAFLRYLSELDVQETPQPLPMIAIRDSADLLVLACAIAAKAKILVTGDKDLLDLPAGASSVKIMTPRDFWTRYRPRTELPET